ncbi:MAG: radical SAM protein [Syntrophaceae bacterium]|jgi:hypothetical protein|nr:radical SAM protein [Syntrophaceae bacterium]
MPFAGLCRILKVILIHPPVSKPSEPPAGLARLSACLSDNFVEHRVIDANLEGMLYLMRTFVRTGMPVGRWSLRACKNLEGNLALLRNPGTFANQSRYSRAVIDINHVLNVAGQPCVNLSLSDYADHRLSPVKSDDLIRAAENPEDNPFYSWFCVCLKDALAECPDYIGFSLNFLSQALCTMAMIGFIKKISPRQKILLGGSLTTSWVQITGRTNLFPGLADEVVTGAGEDKLLKLLGINNIRKNRSTDYRLLSPNDYLSPGFVLPYSAARGCWWQKCAFCPEHSENNPYFPMQIPCVTDELQKLTKRHHPSLIHLLDSAISPALLNALIKQPPGAPWYGFTRITRHLMDEDFCRALKKSGCAMLKLGMESGNQSVLDQLHKGIDLPIVEKTLKNLKKSGISIYGYFLFGTPPENEESAFQTLDFVCRHANCIDFLNLAIFNLPAGSPEAKSLATEDFYDGDLSLYKNFKHPQNWQRVHVRNFLDKVFKRHPAVVPIVKRTPQFFTSNHAPFFTFPNF